MMILWFFTYPHKYIYPGEPDTPEKIIMALKLSSTVHGTSTGERVRREAPAAVRDSDVDSDHDIYRKSSQICGHQEVCEEYTSHFKYTPPGKVLYLHHSYMDTHCLYIYTCIVQCIKMKAKSVITMEFQ